MVSDDAAVVNLSLEAAVSAFMASFLGFVLTTDHLETIQQFDTARTGEIISHLNY